jgi:hypothetical protein
MTHVRKSFIVYPPNYQPFVSGPRYRLFHSKRQAFKQANRWGSGSMVMDSIHIHPKPRTGWQSSLSKKVWWLD